MKKVFFLCLISFFASARLFAQNLPQFGSVKLQKNKDYQLADSTVLQTANYLLLAPINRDTTTLLNAAQFLMKWMDGTTDYTFTLNENSTKYFINNGNLMAVYMAAMCKAALENKPGVASRKITLRAIKLLLDYANNSSNNVTRTKQIAELSAENEKGRLESFLNL